MFDLKLDLGDFERKAKQLDGAVDQVPYALSKAMNDAAFATRSSLIENTWPSHVKVRNRNFIRAALRVELARKTNLTVAVYDTLGRGHLALHAKGGIKHARGRVAIPTKRVVRTASGVRRNQKPLNLKRAVVKGNLIFQSEGRGRNSRLRLMYKLQPTARIKKDVPFIEDFATSMRREIMARFPGAMAQAMRTRR